MSNGENPKDKSRSDVRAGLPFDSQWLDEIQRRSAAIDRGEMGVRPAEEVIENVRRKHLPSEI